MTNLFTFHVLTAEHLAPDQRHAVIKLCTAAYEEDFSDFFAAFPGSTHVLAYDQGELVSHAAWVTRWLQPADYPPLRTAYVEAVATAPAHQGKGFASATMRHLASHIQDFELGGLSPSDPVFYARFGWESWCGPLAIRTEQSLLDTPNEGQLMILRLPRTPPLNLDAPMSAEWRKGELW
jgi:aminoglycoside 2'-N-acetyltransferase I